MTSQSPDQDRNNRHARRVHISMVEAHGSHHRQAVAARCANRYVVLVRHFFGRFFDTEAMSPQGEAETHVIQTLGLLAAPNAFLVLVFRPFDFVGWPLVSVRAFVLFFSTIIIGFVMVFKWNLLFPDRLDYLVLGALPVRRPAVFAAKFSVLGLFAGIFLAAVNAFGILFWPVVDSRPGLLQTIWAHAAAVLAGGLFMVLSMASIQALLAVLCGARTFRRASVIVQTLFMTVLVTILLLSPLITANVRGLVRSQSRLLYCLPLFWFLGLYEDLRPAVKQPTVLLKLGHFAVQALWYAAGAFFLTYLLGYRRHMRAIVEAPDLHRSNPGRVRTWIGRIAGGVLLRHPAQRAVFHFISQTITRSAKHRLFLATYGGVGVAMAIITFGSGEAGLLRLPLMLSFVLVSGLRAAFNFPAELRANWMFQISEGNASQCLAATRKWIVLCGILPLFGLLAPVEFINFPSSAALFHLAFGIALSVLLMEILFLGFRKVPFTCSYLPGKVNLVGLGTIYVFGFTAYSQKMAEVEFWLAGMPEAAAGFFIAVAGIIAALAWWSKRAVADAEGIDYEDIGDPVVRTLDLSPM